MPSLAELFPSKYLAKEDFPKPRVLTTESLGTALIGEDKEQKHILYFANCDKGLVLNKSVATVLADMFGDDTDKWIGKRVEVYTDHSIMFAGRRVGGIRLRAAGESKPSVDDDDIPF
jgi:hypothetical protein